MAAAVSLDLERLHDFTKKNIFFVWIILKIIYLKIKGLQSKAHKTRRHRICVHIEKVYSYFSFF